jgi:1,4-alpha-glucan branching enzyme
LPTSRWSIHEPHPALSHVTSTNPTTAKPASESVRLQVVRFEVFAPGAHAVFLAGSFNDWNPTATPMTACGEAKWVKELSLSPANYQYRFVVDGQWIEDPKANDSVPNPFGGCNSVVHVE